MSCKHIDIRHHFYIKVHGSPFYINAAEESEWLDHTELHWSYKGILDQLEEKGNELSRILDTG